MSRQRIRICLLLLFSLVLAVADGCCGRKDPSMKEIPEGTYYIFGNRRHHKWEYIYVFGRGVCFVQVHSFPGYEERKFYSCADVDHDIVANSMGMLEVKGDISPPFVPDVPWYARFAIRLGKKGAIIDKAYFDNEGRNAAAIGQWMDYLQQTIVKPENECTEIPDWVMNIEEIRKLLIRMRPIPDKPEGRAEHNQLD